MSLPGQVNLFGNNQSVEPPDTQLAAGPTSLLEMDNDTGSIWSKSGGLVKAFDLNVFFGLPSTFFFTDPRVMFDQESGRWFASGMGFDANLHSEVLVAVSSSTDPASSWFVYTVSAASATLKDQPMIGVSSDKVVVSWDDFPPSPTSTRPPTETLVLTKSGLIAGTGGPTVSFGPDTTTFRIVPAQSVAPTTTQWLAFNNTAGGAIGVIAITGVPSSGNVQGVQFGLPVVGTSAPPGAAQLGSTNLIDTGDDRFMSAVWQNGTLWVSGNTACRPPGDATVRACMRLMEVDTTPATPAVKQDFDVFNQNGYSYYPAVSVDTYGNMFVVFSRSDANSYPGIGAVEQAAAAPGTLDGGVNIVNGNGPYPGKRWGDYSGAAMDPADPTHVWVAGELSLSGNSGWGTAAASLFRLDVSSVVPSSGSFSGGDTVTINGQGFQPGMMVKFGSTSSSTVTVTSNTQLTAVVPVGYGKVDVTVISPGGASATEAGAFTYAPAPNVKYFTWYDMISDPGFKGDNIHVVNPGSSTATVVVNIPGSPGCTQLVSIDAGQEKFVSCPTGFGGPVTVGSDLPVLASQRVQYYQSFNEVVAQDASAAQTSLYFSWFDRVSSPGFKGDNVHVLNPGTAMASVTVHLPGCSDQSGSIPAGQEQYFTCANGYGGPVKVTSTQPVLASQRVQYYQSFNEVLAQGSSAAQSKLLFTWFDRVSSPGFQGDNVHVINPGLTTANVTIHIPGCSDQSQAIAAGGEQFFTCPGGFGGPVTVSSDVAVLASQRVQYYQSFNEVLAQGSSAGKTKLYFTWFDRVSSPGFQGDNVHVMNPGMIAANVTVHIPGCLPDQSGSVAGGQEQFFTCSSGFGGPVTVTSDQPVLASQRVQYYQSFNEVLGLTP